MIYFSKGIFYYKTLINAYSKMVIKKKSFIQQKQSELIQNVKDNIYLFITLRLSNNLENNTQNHIQNHTQINIYTKKLKLFDTVLRLEENYSKYYNESYKIKSIKIIETKNRNPHIKI